MINDNILLMTDSYKVTHWKQYPKEVKYVHSYFEARVGSEFDQITFFGLQYLLMRYLEGQVVTQEKIEEAAELFKLHFGSEEYFNREGWEYILNKHEGRLPVQIRAVAEGSVVPVDNVLFTIENTDPEVPWLVNYLETLLVQVWYPCTVATQSREMKKTLRNSYLRTGTPLPGLDFKLHDFGYRGSTSSESAALGGAAHLLNFQGTDTFAAIDLLRKYYGASMPGFSIPAAEHSTIVSWGRERETEAYRNMLQQYPGLVAVVSDSYDIMGAVRALWCGSLAEEVLQHKGAVVIRPDSGDPVKLVPELLDILWNRFGGTFTGKSFKVLDPHVRLIWGDGIDHKSMKNILDAMEVDGWSTDNIAFGSGGGLLQKLNRDTCRFAMKCSAVSSDRSTWTPVYKAPKSDMSKQSKSGRLGLYKRNGVWFTMRRDISVMKEELMTVFANGWMAVTHDLSSIRSLAQL